MYYTYTSVSPSSPSSTIIGSGLLTGDSRIYSPLLPVVSSSIGLKNNINNIYINVTVDAKIRQNFV